MRRPRARHSDRGRHDHTNDSEHPLAPRLVRSSVSRITTTHLNSPTAVLPPPATERSRSQRSSIVYPFVAAPAKPPVLALRGVRGRTNCQASTPEAPGRQFGPYWVRSGPPLPTACGFRSSGSGGSPRAVRTTARGAEVMGSINQKSLVAAWTAASRTYLRFTRNYVFPTIVRRSWHAVY
jgi:hypothetical protein